MLQCGSYLHGKVGDERRGGQVHLEGGLLGDGELVPYRALDCGDGIAGHHRTHHVVVCYLQLVAAQLQEYITSSK